MNKFLVGMFSLLLVASFILLDNSEIFKEEGKIEVFFCPQDDCETALINFIDSAKKSVDCALFEVNLDSVKKKLIEKDAEINVRVVVDDNYYEKFNEGFVKKDRSGLMHNKFCVADDYKILTGSMNPTFNGVNKNNNNLLVIESKYLAKNYEAEFKELWQGVFKKGDNVEYPEILLSAIKIENYFCPEDSCQEQIIEELKKAKKSINFMTFLFTDEDIANTLLMKNLDGIIVSGIMEARQINKYSQFDRLLNNGINVVKDSNKNNMHHKVFIIDSKTVITGSFNPSNNADKRNDENILIIQNMELAGMFIDELEGLLKIK
jgi:phosphatidylserine/phosphatidylglycerophosphate/cardiolipin synthase-like enzyme